MHCLSHCHLSISSCATMSSLDLPEKSKRKARQKLPNKLFVPGYLWAIQGDHYRCQNLRPSGFFSPYRAIIIIVEDHTESLIQTNRTMEVPQHYFNAIYPNPNPVKRISRVFHSVAHHSSWCAQTSQHITFNTS